MREWANENKKELKEANKGGDGQEQGKGSGGPQEEATSYISQEKRAGVQ